MKDLLPPLALVLLFGLTWGGAWWRRRRFRAAVAALQATHAGRFEPGSHTSGGTLYIKLDGRDVVFSFYLGSSRAGASTKVMTVLPAPLDRTLTLRRREAVARVPGLKPFSGLFAFGVELRAEFNLLSIEVPGVVRDAPRLLDLASMTLHLGKELEG